MVLLPYSAWGAELTEDYHGRSRVSASREVFVIIGTILAAGLPAAFGEDRGRALEVLFWILLVTLPVALALALTLVPEPAPKPAAALPTRPPRPITLQYLYQQLVLRWATQLCHDRSTAPRTRAAWLEVTL